MSDDSLTLGSDGSDGASGRGLCLGLRILSHPDLERVGDFSILFAHAEPEEIELSRSEPSFVDGTGKARGSLATRHVSRAGVRLRRREGGSLVVRRPLGQTKLSLDGEPVEADQVLSEERLSAGVVLTFGRSVALFLGPVDVVPAPELPALIGVSAAAKELRRRLAALAKLDTSVLIVGEAGSGKSQAARALHALGTRARQPWVEVNATLLADQSAAGVLLGPALSEAALLPKASAGTLFLRGLPELALRAQSELVRTLDFASARAAAGDQSCAARILASSAVDPALEQEPTQLTRALIDRFAQVVRVPALRARREDIAVLFVHFLREALAEHGASQRLTARSDEGAFVPATLMTLLVHAAWPGNVRQLRNLAYAFALENHAASEARIQAWVSENVGPLLPASPPGDPPAASELTDEQIKRAMIASNFNITRAAKLLNVSKAWLHPHLEQSGLLPRAKDLSQTAIESALAQSEYQVKRAAEQLNVSKHGLSLRMNALGIRLPRKRGANGSSPH